MPHKIVGVRQTRLLSEQLHLDWFIQRHVVIQRYHVSGTWLETLTSATNLFPSNLAHQTLEETIHPLLTAHAFWPFDVDFAVKHLFDLWRE